MRRARIHFAGREQWGAVEGEGDAQCVRLADGQCIASKDVHWLTPVTPGATIFALGLNYGEHRAELGFAKASAAPLVFLKGHATLAGHQSTTPYPSDAHQMHPECELVAVIGKPARGVQREQALGHVAAYTIANDYAVREYLENYYRPNTRVKNRDGATPLGPWLVDASDIGDPQDLRLQTRVNGEIVQDGATADMILSVADLICYLSGFMTLLPGDMILTGTPAGVKYVAPGDEVVCEIERIGRLCNRLEAPR